MIPAWLDGEFKSVWLEPAPTTRAHPRDPFEVWATDTGDEWVGWRETERKLAKVKYVKHVKWPKAHWLEVPPPPASKNKPEPVIEPNKPIVIHVCKAFQCRFEPTPNQDPDYCVDHQPHHRPKCDHEVFLHVPCDSCYALYGNRQMRLLPKKTKKKKKSTARSRSRYLVRSKY